MRKPGWIVLSAALLLAPATRGSESPPPPRPHIVFLLADDLGWTDVGWHGSEIQTPHLDKLAAAGAKLEQFYVQPVCSPTRAALLTGRYPMRHGLQVGVVRPWARYGLPLDERTLPAALQQVGYTTAICGKWHLGHFRPEYLPTRRGFSLQYGHYNGALDYFTHERDGGHDWHRNDLENRDPGYTTVLLGDEAVRIVEQHDMSQPLFLYVPFNAPHAPLQALDEHLAAYAHIAESKRRTYCAMVHCLDEQVGRVVAAVEKRGQTERTLFVFSSDNGGPLNLGATNGPLRAGKGTLYEGGVRVAACAAWAGQIQPGTVVDQPLHMVDWYPTLLRLAGASLQQEQPLDGRDAWPAIVGGKPSPHTAILLNTTPTNGAIRMGDWKLVLHGGAPDTSNKPNPRKKSKAKPQNAPAVEAIELFNLADDPHETNNLAAARADKVQELRARLAAFAREAAPPRSEPQPKDYRAPRVWGQAETPNSEDQTSVNSRNGDL